MRHLFYSTFFILWAISCSAQQATFKVARVCDSATMAYELLGVWADTAHKGHTLEFTRDTVLSKDNNIDPDINDTVNKERWNIESHTIKPGAVCEFSIQSDGNIRYRTAIIHYYQKSRCMILDDKYLIIKLDTDKKTEVYKRIKHSEK